MSDEVKCALTGMANTQSPFTGNERKTWCDRIPGPGEWTFTDASHAALNAKVNGRLVLCRECTLRIIGVLKDPYGW